MIIITAQRIIQIPENISENMEKWLKIEGKFISFYAPLEQ